MSPIKIRWIRCRNKSVKSSKGIVSHLEEKSQQDTFIRWIKATPPQEHHRMRTYHVYGQTCFSIFNSLSFILKELLSHNVKNLSAKAKDSKDGEKTAKSKDFEVRPKLLSSGQACQCQKSLQRIFTAALSFPNFAQVVTSPLVFTSERTQESVRLNRRL